jgi:hypothetical protein
MTCGFHSGGSTMHYINKMQEIKRVETKMLKMHGINIFVPPR